MDRPDIGESHESAERQHLPTPSHQLTIDGEMPYESARAAAVPSRPGVYLIVDLRGVLYVGASGDLQRSFDEHLQETENDLLQMAMATPSGQLRFAWILDDDVTGVWQRLVAQLMPVCNERR